MTLFFRLLDNRMRQHVTLLVLFTYSIGRILSLFLFNDALLSVQRFSKYAIISVSAFYASDNDYSALIDFHLTHKHGQSRFDPHRPAIERDFHHRLCPSWYHVVMRLVNLFYRLSLYIWLYNRSPPNHGPSSNSWVVYHYCRTVCQLLYCKFGPERCIMLARGLVHFLGPTTILYPIMFLLPQQLRGVYSRELSIRLSLLVFELIVDSHGLKSWLSQRGKREWALQSFCPICNGDWKRWKTKIVESQPLSKRQEDFCTICWQNWFLGENVLLLRCEHVFHEVCFSSWMKRSNKFACPICSTPA